MRGAPQALRDDLGKRIGSWTDNNRQHCHVIWATKHKWSGQVCRTHLEDASKTDESSARSDPKPNTSGL